MRTVARFLENQVKQFDLNVTTFSQYLGPCLSNPFSYREGVRVNTVGPNVLYSCFMFHTSTNQLCEKNHRNNNSQFWLINVSEVRVV